jgi:hypothetical protein
MLPEVAHLACQDSNPLNLDHTVVFILTTLEMVCSGVIESLCGQQSKASLLLGVDLSFLLNIHFLQTFFLYPLLQ